MRTIRTTKEFEKIWNEAEVLVVDFSAEWCEPCKLLKPLLKKLEKEYPGITVAMVDVDKHEALSEQHELEYVPTLLFVKKGRVLHRTVGLQDYETLVEGLTHLARSSRGRRA